MDSNIFLFLCSSFADVAPLLEQTSPIELREKIVTFIPTASIPESYKEDVGLGREALEKLGLRVETLDVSESAGAMILAPSVEYVQLMDETQVAPELTSFAALGAITKYPLPHYQCFPFVEIGETVISTFGGQLSLVPITNHQAIIVRGGEFTIVTKE